MATKNLLLTAEQQEFAALAAEIVKKELAPRVAELDQTGEFPMDVMDALRGAGFYGMGIPEQYGGLGLDVTTQMAIYKERLPLFKACLLGILCVKIAVGGHASHIVHGYSDGRLDARVDGCGVDRYTAPPADADDTDALRVNIMTKCRCS